MKFSSVFAVVLELRTAVYYALLPTLRDILKTPILLISPQRLSQVFFGHVWAVLGPGMDEGSKELKENLITPNAYGVVLDIGAGTGCCSLSALPQGFDVDRRGPVAARQSQPII